MHAACTTNMCSTACGGPANCAVPYSLHTAITIMAIEWQSVLLLRGAPDAARPLQSMNPVDDTKTLVVTMPYPTGDKGLLLASWERARLHAKSRSNVLNVGHRNYTYLNSGPHTERLNRCSLCCRRTKQSPRVRSTSSP